MWSGMSGSLSVKIEGTNTDDRDGADTDDRDGKDTDDGDGKDTDVDGADRYQGYY
jgi:hypothetical protein